VPLTSPKLIGRRAELRTLESALSQAADGRLRRITGFFGELPAAAQN